MSRYRVGLTGGIGSGKSTVAQLFAQHGVPVIDTDELSRQLTAPGGAAMPAIIATFGADYASSNGALERTRMRQLVFSDPTARQRLEDILHPMILELARTMAEASPAPYVLLVVPLLFESGQYGDWVQRTLVVDCPEEEQLRRTMQRSQLDADAVRAIMAQQVSRQQRLALADDILHNDQGAEALPPQVERLHKQYLMLAARSN
ncbi:MAG TPA: dephospho-CoA kinase [Gallionellaceae bacterium]|nr:dephospho-CoA kinase [Gallionellaceae bacterium]